MGLLSVFANFRIDSEERLLRMQDSFCSFYNEDVGKWVVNIRGPLKEEAGEFLSNRLGKKLELFELESKKGWFHDSRKMLNKINSDYVFFWIEDHLNINPKINIIKKITLEMKDNNVDSLWYTFFPYMKYYIDVKKKEEKYISWFDLDENSLQKIHKLKPDIYLISCASILNQNLFKKIIKFNDKRLAFKWPKETPFNFEKSYKDIHWLPFRCGILHHELFVAIDDDTPEPGSSLISRGLYPERKSRVEVGMQGNVRTLWPNKNLSVKANEYIKNVLKILLIKFSFMKALKPIYFHLKYIKTKLMIPLYLNKDKKVFLELGSGNKKGKNGWLTIDCRDKCDLFWDLNKGIPFPNESISKIYSSHFFEHLSYKEAQKLLDESLRVLIPGGKFLISVPNAKIYIDAYVKSNLDKEKFIVWNDAFNNTTKIDYINYIAYMDGVHKYMFDEENLLHILKAKGFNDVKLRVFDSQIDLKSRDYESIYAQGIK